MNSVAKLRPLPLALTLCGWLPTGCTDPQICVGDCTEEGETDGEGETEDGSGGDSLEALRTCNLPTTADVSQCGDDVAQPGELCLAEPVSISLGDEPYASAVGDFDGDGRADLMWSTEFGTLSLNLGAAMSTLEEGRGWSLPGEDASPLTTAAAADFDGDGFVDVVTVSSVGQIDLLRGDGAGDLLEVRSVLSDPQLAWGPHAVDDDADGDLDLAIIIAGAPQNRLTLVNDGLGNFTLTPRFDESGSTLFPRTVVDFDGLLLADHLHGEDDQIFLRRELPGGTSTTIIDLPASYLRASDIEVADHDADGFMDLFALVSDRDALVDVGGSPFEVYTSLVVFEGVDAGTPSAVALEQSAALPLDCSASDLRVVDVNGDGVVDAVSSHHAVNEQSASVVVRLGGGAEPFGQVLRVPAPAGIDSGGPVHVGDFDGDGLTDVLTVHRNDGALVLYRGRR